MIRAILIAFLFSVSAFGQTWNQAESLTNLLTRTPVVGGWYSVKGYRTPGDWGSERTAQYVRGDTTTTNIGNVFAWSGGRLKFFDGTNTVQDLRWWGGDRSNTHDTYASLVACYGWIEDLGGGTVRVPAGTYKFLTDGIEAPSGVNLEGDGPTSVLNFTQTGSTNYPFAIRYAGSRSAGSALWASVSAGGYSLVTSSDLSLSQGDTVAIYNTNDFSGGGRSYYRAGQFAKVSGVTGSTNISLATPLYASYGTNGVFVYKVTHTRARVKDIHFALPVQSAGLTIHYGGRDVLLENVSAAGSEYQHIGFHSCFGSRLKNGFIESDSTPVGLNYGVLIGSSQDVVIDGGTYAAALSGIETGNTDTDLDFFCRGLQILNVNAYSIRQAGPGVGFHGNTIDSVIQGGKIQGVHLAGGNQLLDAQVENGPNYSAINGTEMYRFDSVIRGNTFVLRRFNDTEAEWLGRITLAGVNAAASSSVNTNIWAGTWGNTTNQFFRFEGNSVWYLNTFTRSGDYGLYIDESSTLSANPNAGQATFGGVIFRGNTFSFPDSQPFSALTTASLIVRSATNVIFREIIVDGKNVMPYGGVRLDLNGGRVLVEGNTLSLNLDPQAAIRINRNADVGGYQPIPLDAVVIGNTIDGAQAAGLSFVNYFGTLKVTGNTFRNYGQSGSSAYGFLADYIGGNSTNLVRVENRDNTFQNDLGGTIYSYSINAPSAHLDERDNRTLGTTAGTLTVSTRRTLPYIANAQGATNAVALVGSFATASLPTGIPPAITWDSTVGRAVAYDGSAWAGLRWNADTNFPNLYVTNTVNAEDIATDTISIGPSRLVFAALSDPIYVLHSTNGPVRLAIQNNNTGSAAQSGISLTAGGSTGTLLMRSPNDSSSSLTNRLVLDGPRLGFEIDSGADVRFLVSGSPFATLSESLLDVPRLQTKAATNVPTHVLITGADPTSTARQVQATTLANLKNSLAISSADITDSTSAGRALLTAANASAQRSSLGLGTIATIDDAPSDGNQYVRSNATWAIASGGGGGISGIRVTDGTTDADGITNILFNPAGGSGFAITVTDMGTRADVDFEWLSPGFGINGTFPTYGTERWNLNDTTPSAPAGSSPVRLQSNSTNASAYVAVAPTVVVSQSAWSNSVAAVTIASGFLNKTNMPFDGALLTGPIAGTLYNESGANTTLVPILIIGGTTNYATASGINLANSATIRPWRIQLDMQRVSSSAVVGGLEMLVSASAGPGGSYPGVGSMTSSPTVTGRNVIGVESAVDVTSSNVAWALQLQLSTASVSNRVNVVYGGLK
jgi:hypothetical protein